MTTPGKSYKRLTEKIAALKTELANEEAEAGRNDENITYAKEVTNLQQDLERRQESYIRREKEYRSRISTLENQLKSVKDVRAAELETDEHMRQLRSLHSNIIGKVGNVQSQTARILQEQERDLLRAFRARLFDVQTELEKEKTRVEEGAAVWIEKNRQLEKELDWAKEMADRLDRRNQSLLRENRRLQTQFKTQEDDREYLIRQLVAAKKDNARLRSELNRTKDELSKVTGELREKEIFEGSPALEPLSARSGKGKPLTGRTRPGTGASSGSQAPEEGHMTEARYKDVIRRLKRLLEVERKNLRQVRASYAAELQGRSELELLLRQCVEDVKIEISKKREQLMSGASPGSLAIPGVLPPVGASGGPPLSGRKSAGSSVPHVIPASEFSQEERERVLELLLSQERVINLLYSRTFPSSSDQPPVDFGAPTSAESSSPRPQLIVPQLSEKKE